MVELITYIARSLVTHPEQVDVRENDMEHSMVIELRVAPEDMGKVIGKQGRIAKSIRAVLKSASAQNRKPVYLEII